MLKVIMKLPLALALNVLRTGDRHCRKPTQHDATITATCARAKLVG